MLVSFTGADEKTKILLNLKCLKLNTQP